MSSSYRHIGVLGALAMVMAVSGCYTVLNHPRVAPDQQVTESGTVIKEDQCASCHTQGELWAFHHYPYGGDPFYASPSHSPSLSGSLVWDYYYYRHDPYFVRARWYRDTYYRRWYAYHHSPWWCCDDDWTGVGPGDGGRDAVGRGAARDGYDRSGPRTQAPDQNYDTYMGPASSSSRYPGVHFVPSNGSASKEASEEEQSAQSGRPHTVRSRDGSTDGAAARSAASSSEPGNRARGSSANDRSDDSQKPARGSSSGNNSDDDSDGRSSSTRSR